MKIGGEDEFYQGAWRGGTVNGAVDFGEVGLSSASTYGDRDQSAAFGEVGSQGSTTHADAVERVSQSKSAR